MSSSESAGSPASLSWLAHPMRELVRLSVPVTISMLSYSVMTLVDTYFVAELGTTQLAGVGLGGTVAFTLISFGFGLVRGGKTLVSQAVGAGKREEAGAYLGAALITGALFGLLSLVLQWPIGLLLTRASSSEAQSEAFRTYLLVRSFGGPSAMLFTALREVRYGRGDSRSPMIATLLANALNIVLAWLFVRRLGYGVAGAAWATVIAQTFEAGVLALAQHGEGWGVSAMRRGHLMSLVRIGLPSGVQMLLEVGAFLVLASVIASISPVQMAAHQITLQLISFSFLPAYAIGESASVLVGQVVGAARDELVPRLATLALRLVTAYTGLCTLCFLVCPEQLIGAFPSDPETHALAVRVLRVCTLFLICDGANIVARSTLRGTGDVTFPMWVGVIASWALTPPLAWLLGIHLGLGAVGGWLGLTAEVFLATAIQWSRLARGGWKPHAERARAEVLAAAGS